MAPWGTLTLVQSERGLALLSKVTVPDGAGSVPSPVKVAVNETPSLTFEEGVGDGTNVKLASGGSDCRFDRTENSVPGDEDSLLPLAVARLACLVEVLPTAVSAAGPLPTGNAVAGCNVPSPFPNRTLAVESFTLATATSVLPSPLKSATTRDPGLLPTAYGRAAWNVPSPLPRSTATVLSVDRETIRSRPEPIRFPSAIEDGLFPSASTVPALNLPVPSPSSTVPEPGDRHEASAPQRFATTMSSFLSPLMSPMASEVGE